MPRRRSKAFVAALPLTSLPQLEQLLAPFLGDRGARGHVVMVRLGDDSVARLDELVESGLFGSRSEAAAFLVGAGIKAQHELFERIAWQTAEIKKLRSSLREAALEALGGVTPPQAAERDTAEVTPDRPPHSTPGTRRPSRGRRSRRDA